MLAVSSCFNLWCFSGMWATLALTGMMGLLANFVAQNVPFRRFLALLIYGRGIGFR